MSEPTVQNLAARSDDVTPVPRAVMPNWQCSFRPTTNVATPATGVKRRRGRFAGPAPCSPSAAITLSW